MLVGGVVPGQVEQRTVPLVGRSRPASRGSARPARRRTAVRFGTRPAVPTAWCRHCSSRWVWVNEPAFSTWVAAGRKNTSVSMSSRAQFAGCDLRAVLPPGGRLDEVQVAHHQPLQVRHAQALHPAVGRADGRVLAEQEVALHLVLEHVHHRLVGAVRSGQPGQVVVGPVVLGAVAASPHHALSRLTV